MSVDAERRMRGRWERVLGRAVPSTADNFFALGGTSLQAIELLNQVNEEFGCELDILSLLENPSIETLVRVASNDATAPGAVGS